MLSVRLIFNWAPEVHFFLLAGPSLVCPSTSTSGTYISVCYAGLTNNTRKSAKDHRFAWST